MSFSRLLHDIWRGYRLVWRGSFNVRKKGADMHRNSQSAQEPPPTNHSTMSSSRWLVLAVALCGALAGGSIVEAIAALASGSRISITPDHLIAEPLLLAGAFSGGLLAAILASRDHGIDQSNDQCNDQMIAHALAPADIVPSEPMQWQPAPHMLPPNRTLTATSMPSARSKHRVRYTHRKIRPRTSHFPQTRPAISRSSAIMNTPRHP